VERELFICSGSRVKKGRRRRKEGEAYLAWEELLLLLLVLEKEETKMVATIGLLELLLLLPL
jgi:hypothetical protein